MTARLYHFPRKRITSYDTRLEDASNLLADLSDAIAYGQLTTLERILWVERCLDMVNKLTPPMPQAE